MDGLIGTIVEAGKATLNELKTIYTLEDALVIWECIVIPRFNSWMAAEREKRQRKAKAR